MSHVASWAVWADQASKSTRPNGPCGSGQIDERQHSKVQNFRNSISPNRHFENMVFAVHIMHQVLWTYGLLIIPSHRLNHFMAIFFKFVHFRWWSAKYLRKAVTVVAFIPARTGCCSWHAVKRRNSDKSKNREFSYYLLIVSQQTVISLNCDVVNRTQYGWWCCAVFGFYIWRHWLHSEHVCPWRQPINCSGGAELMCRPVA